MKEEVMLPARGANKKKKSTKNVYLTILIIAVCSVSIWFGLLQLQMPEVTSHTASKEQFSAERAMDYLEVIASEPRPIGAVAHDRVRDYLVATLTAFGLSPEVQVATENLSVWGTPYEGKVENIVARIAGTDSTGAIMITSHYDSESNSPGAADAGSGVVAILETVSVLTETGPLKNDIIILLSDGEEIGLLGAQAFVQEHPWAEEVDLVLNFEARGSSGPSVMFEMSEQNERLAAEFAKGTSYPISHSIINDIYKTLPNDTDLSIYKKAGMYGLNFGFFVGLFSYHTPEDTVENLNVPSLQHHGENMLDLVRHFGNLELAAQEDGKNLYFNVFGKKVVTYSEKLVLPFMVAAILLFIMTYIHGYHRKKLSMAGSGIGLFVFLIIVASAYFMGESLVALVSFITGLDLWTIAAHPRISNPVFIGVLLIVFVLTMIMYHWLLKRVNGIDMTMGGLFGWLLLLGASSLSFPSSSYVFLWPFVVVLSLLNLYLLLKKEFKMSGKILSLCMMVLPIIFAVPIIYLVYALITLQEVGVLTASASLLLVFFIPVLQQARFLSRT